MDMMRIWQLAPIDASDEAWRNIEHKDVALVRARSADRARVLASTLLFRPRAKSLPDDRIATSPWRRDDQVSIEEETESDFSEEGPEEVLLPAD